MTSAHQQKISFSKYHGHGNDFILLDNTHEVLLLSREIRHLMCDRKYGIGADGIVILKRSVDHSFVIDYYNADGNPGSLCGNGSRCGLAFARKLGLFDTVCDFVAYDGLHIGRYIQDNGTYAVSFGNKYFHDIETIDDQNFFVNTGSPHHVRYVNNLNKYDVINEGKELRYGKYVDTNGSNVNFVEKKSDGNLFVRTYERGVDGETEACGTGAVAVALVTKFRHLQDGGKDTCKELKKTCDIYMGRGKLIVVFDITENSFTNIELIGSACHVFDGIYYLNTE